MFATRCTIIQGTENRFDKHVGTVYLIYGLILSVISKRKIPVKHMTEQYQDDLLNPVNVEE